MRGPGEPVVVGGPAQAPSAINSVIGTATIRSALEGYEVLGIEDGFSWIMQGNVDSRPSLTIESVSRIHFRGGSHIGIARANPTTSPELLEKSVLSLLRLNVSQLITIGGDDTAHARHAPGGKSAGRLQVGLHVPSRSTTDLEPAARRRHLRLPDRAPRGGRHR